MRCSDLPVLEILEHIRRGSRFSVVSRAHSINESSVVLRLVHFGAFAEVILCFSLLLLMLMVAMGCRAGTLLLVD